jgi:hypothetical protein
MSDPSEYELSLDRSNVVWHDPIDFDMTVGAPPGTVVSLEQCNMHLYAHPLIELDSTVPTEGADRPKSADDQPPPEQDKKSA